MKQTLTTMICDRCFDNAMFTPNDAGYGKWGWISIASHDGATAIGRVFGARGGKGVHLCPSCVAEAKAWWERK